MNPPRLLPNPRQLQLTGGVCTTRRVTESTDPSGAKPQGYQITITPDAIQLIGHDAAGLHYGRLTLAQIFKQYQTGLPCLRITDSPDFLVRGVMLDISRDKVPTMATLFALVDRLAGWKINQLQLYTEHTFAYPNHPAVWKTASPMTAAEIVALDRYCAARHIELVPNQNSFGHMERWLKLPQYRDLAEVEEGADTPWGFRWKGPFSLCPTDPRSVEFLADLYNQLLPNFTSRLFNVGCDETFDIGQGASRAAAEQRGKHEVYLEFLKKVHQLVTERGRTMMCWGDIILHQPELIAKLPKPIIALNWGYEADHPFDDEGRRFAESGVPHYVCPGTSSWLSIAGRSDNMLANQFAAAEAGLRHGAVGFLNTDWGDHGHLQYLPISYPGFAAGAAASWCLQTNRDVLDRILENGAMRCAFELGNTYRALNRPWNNSTALFRILVPASTHKNPLEGLSIEDLQNAQAAINQIDLQTLTGLQRDELSAAQNMLRHACRRGMWQFDPRSISPAELAEEMRSIIADHRRLWLARNRPGGLDDSAARLESCLAEYTLPPKNG